MLDLIDSVTNEALCHQEFCECVICRAASGDKDALRRCEAAHHRVNLQADGKDLTDGD
jgi:hypothetical protein